MADTTVPVQGGTGTNITIAAAALISTYGAQPYQVIQIVGYPNEPSQPLVLFSGSGAYTSSVFASGATVQVLAGASPVTYNIGVSAVAGVVNGFPVQAVPGTLNATGTLTAALIYTRIVTSTTAAAVAATLDTGAIMEASAAWAIGDFIQWYVINTGGNTLTVTASTGHTIVGVAAVLTVTSATFRTKKTAANTFVTYRLS